MSLTDDMQRESAAGSDDESTPSIRSTRRRDRRTAVISIAVVAVVALFLSGVFTSASALAVTIQTEQLPTQDVVIYGVVKSGRHSKTYRVVASYRRRHRRHHHGYEVAATTVTGEDGTFRLELPEREGLVKLTLKRLRNRWGTTVHLYVEPGHAYRVDAKVRHHFGFWYFPVFAY